MQQLSLENNELNPQKPLYITSKYDDSANVILHCGDVSDFIHEIPDNSLDLVMTSPPYNLGKVYEKQMSIHEYLEEQTIIIEKIIKKIKPTGSICWQVGNYVDKGEVYPLDIYYYNIFKQQFSLFLRNRIVWFFGHGLHATKRFSGRYETILWFTKSDKYTFNLDSVRVPSKYPGKRHYRGLNKGKPSGNPLGKNPSDIWEMVINEFECGLIDIPNVKANHPEKTTHPCQFPIELVERCVLAFTNEGDTVFDPYAGVGSTLIGSVKHGRKSIGTEKEQDYCSITHQRLNDYQEGTLKVREIGTTVFVPTGKESVSRIPQEWLSE